MQRLHKTNLSTGLNSFPVLGAENTGILDILVALLLATAPLLQHYKGIAIFHAGFLVLIACIPYIGIKLLLRIRQLEWKNLWYALPLVLFQVYRVLAHGTDFIEFMHGVVLSAYFVAIALGGINLFCVAVSACVIAFAAGVAVLVQTIGYYAFGIHLQLAAPSLLLEESASWIALVKTGLIGITGNLGLIYRPSAFFLEPSHMLMYSMPVLFILLLTPQMTPVKRICAVMISLGLMLCTSGMGILFVFGVWMLRLGFSNGAANRLAFRNLFRKQNILHCFAFLLVFCTICFALPFMRYAVLRNVFSGSELAKLMPQTVQTLTDFRTTAMEAHQAMEPVSTEEPTAAETPGPAETPDSSETPEPAETPDPSATPSTSTTTALSGRTKWPLKRLKQMTEAELCVGIGDSLPDRFDFPKPGFFATMFKYGIIGTVISYLYYLFCACCTKHAYRWIAIITILLSFVDAQTHGTFCMLFYVMILMGGCQQRSAERAAKPCAQGAGLAEEM